MTDETLLIIHSNIYSQIAAALIRSNATPKEVHDIACLMADKYVSSRLSKTETKNEAAEESK